MKQVTQGHESIQIILLIVHLETFDHFRNIHRLTNLKCIYLVYKHVLKVKRNKHLFGERKYTKHIKNQCF